MNHINPQTFTVLDEYFAKDATSVYAQGMIIVEADLRTFSVLTG
jgi:hypothetical protein